MLPVLAVVLFEVKVRLSLFGVKFSSFCLLGQSALHVFVFQFVVGLMQVSSDYY